MYINRETGELLTCREMLKQFAEDYDGNDPTNVGNRGFSRTNAFPGP